MNEATSGGTMQRSTPLRLALIALAGLSAQPALRAQGVFETPDKFTVNANWKFVSIDTEARLVHKGTFRTSLGINFEDTFDIPVQKQAWSVNGTWRLSDRHLLDVGYMSINRVGSKTIETAITWGDYTIDANAAVRATFDTNFPYLGYRYGFYEGGDLEMSVGGGISYLHVAMGLFASGTLTDYMDGDVETSASKTGKFDIPVPLLAFQIDGRLSKNWFMTGYYRSFFYSRGDFKGGTNVFGLTANWFPSRHYGIGVGLERTVIDIQRVTTGTYEARFKYNISGLTASAAFRF